MCLYPLWHFLSKYIAHGLMFTVTLISTALVLWESEPVCFALALPCWVFSSIEMASEYLLLITQQHTHQRVLRLWEKAETQQWVSHRRLNAYLTALPMKSGHILATTVSHINGCDMMGLVYSAWMVESNDLALFLLLLSHISTAMFNTMLSETTDKLPKTSRHKRLGTLFTVNETKRELLLHSAIRIVYAGKVSKHFSWMVSPISLVCVNLYSFIYPQ